MSNHLVCQFIYFTMVCLTIWYVNFIYFTMHLPVTCTPSHKNNQFIYFTMHLLVTCTPSHKNNQSGAAGVVRYGDVAVEVGCTPLGSKHVPPNGQTSTSNSLNIHTANIMHTLKGHAKADLGPKLPPPEKYTKRKH